MKSNVRLVLTILLGGLLVAAGWAQETTWAPGARVLVDKAGLGRHAIVLKVESGRCFVAYEGTDERFDEWVEVSLLRAIKPRSVLPTEPTVLAKSSAVTDAVVVVPETGLESVTVMVSATARRWTGPGGPSTASCRA